MTDLSVDTQPVEELALFNPAFIALLLQRCAHEHQLRAGNRLFPTMLAYLVVPLTLHGPTRRQLPSHVTTQMAEWIRIHPEAVVGLAGRARAVRAIVSAGLRFGLTNTLLAGESAGIRALRLPRRPRGMVRTEEVDECLDKAGFLGRWFAGQADPLTALALWGLRP